MRFFDDSQVELLVKHLVIHFMEVSVVDTVKRAMVVDRAQVIHIHKHKQIAMANSRAMAVGLVVDSVLVVLVVVLVVVLALVSEPALV